MVGMNTYNVTLFFLVGIKISKKLTNKIEYNEKEMTGFYINLNS